MIKPIVLKVQNGLANRLRTLTSFQALAQAQQRPLLLCWQSGAGWSDESFNDLFENQCHQIPVAEFEALERASYCLHRLITKHPYPPFQNLRHASLSITSTLNPNVQLCYCGDQALQQMLTWHELSDVVGFGQTRDQILRSLRPVSHLMQKIDRISSRFKPSTVGVHVRRGDAWHSRHREHFMLSSDQAFLELMAAEIRQADGTDFFVATDCANTQTLLQHHFADRIIVNEEKIFVSSQWNRPKVNQADAVIDLWSLSRTKRIIGSFWSSFSELASDLGDCQLRLAGRC